MDKLRIRECTICGETRSGQARWFLVMEDRWQDKLKILHWDNFLAAHGGIHCVCCPSHLQQLVVHWMSTGSLDHPFAARVSGGESQTNPPASQLAINSLPSSGVRQIGELSVHRESMQRVLNENPQSLQAILDALLGALQRDTPRPEPKIDWEDEAVRTTAYEV